MTESARDIIATWAAEKADRMQGIADHVKADAILAALSAAGFAIVPKYATDAMVRHANEMEDLSGGISFEDAWLAMVIASESALTASKENT